LYWWQGCIESDTEYKLTMKSLKSSWKKLEKAIKELHPYDIPEIIANETFAVSNEYAKWLKEELEYE